MMSDFERKRTQREAQTGAAAPMSSRRAEVWAAMMRYLSGEAARENVRSADERARKREARRSGKQPK